jgi:hypothetical protein
MWQEVRFRLLCDPTRIRHQVRELCEVSDERLSRSDATTAFVGIPAPPYHAPIIARATNRREGTGACASVGNVPPRLFPRLGEGVLTTRMPDGPQLHVAGL